VLGSVYKHLRAFGRHAIGVAGTQPLAGVCLKQQFFPLLAFSIPCFAPDECLSGTQPNDWSPAMSRIKLSDVKTHLHPPFLTKTHPGQPESEPDATGFSAAEPETIKTDASDFADDFITEHSSPGTGVVLGNRATGSVSSQASGNLQKRANVQLHSVFLRSGCILPDRLDPSRQSIGDGWSVVEEIPALAFDTMIRRAGWHFMWLQDACSRRGVGLTEEAAISRALSGALKGISKRFNAAKLDSVEITQYPGFQVANVRVQTLQIQQHSSLNIAAGLNPQPVPAT